MWDRFLRQRAYIGITRSRMRWYVRKIFPTASLHRDHSISHALVSSNTDLVCKEILSRTSDRDFHCFYPTRGKDEEQPQVDP